jgi:hypothetical protein
MMDVVTSQYADWKAPAADGQVLIWPEPKRLLADARENQQRLAKAADVRIQGVALPEIRRNLRNWIGHDAPEQLLFATGHQTELRHPGVWAKDVLIDAAARLSRGAAYHFAVDSDEPKHLTIQWPGASWPLTDDDRLASAAWCGQLQTPTPLHIQNIRRSMEHTDWGYEPMLGTFLDSMRRLTLESNNLPTALSNALHELDWSLGLRQHTMVTSPLWHSDGYLLLAHHILARAKRFASHYNGALRAYREEQGISSDTRPMPDLKLSGDSCEAPFWLDDLVTGNRRRATVHGTAGQWRLALDNAEAFAFSESVEGWDAAQKLGRWLTRHQVRLAPRALTLTLFLRLLLADQFVHGIGGARYDQVLDRLIAVHFGMEPPRFSVTTATLLHPAAVGRERVCMPCIMQQGHRLRHGLLGEEKMKYVERIKALPRRSLDRLEVFQEMHDRLAAAASHHPALGHWELELDKARQQERRNEILFSRELFYAIQPRARLEQIVQEYRQEFS